jgi:hypothetical protein
MSKLSVYNDKECSNLIMSHDIDIINLYAPDIFKNKYWKYTEGVINGNEVEESDNKLNEFEMIEYGEFILTNVEKYVKTDFNIHFFHLFRFIFFARPINFNLDLVAIYISQKQYKPLETYINNYIQFNSEITNIHYDESIHKPFLDFLNELSEELKKYFEEDVYYNSEINHYISKINLAEIKSFGYFNLKFGESGYTGMYINKN